MRLQRFFAAGLRKITTIFLLTYKKLRMDIDDLMYIKAESMMGKA